MGIARTAFICRIASGARYVDDGRKIMVVRHPAMPEFKLAPQQIVDLPAYLKGLALVAG